MGSVQDEQPGDELRRAMLAVRNVGWQGGCIVGVEAWRRMVEHLIEAATKAARA